MTTATAETWIPLEPKLRKGRRSYQLFFSFIMRLRDPGCVREALDRLRADTLEQAGDCGDEAQLVRVLVSILCDLRGKGWRVRIQDGAAAVAPPAENGGSVLEQKERVRSSLLLERDAQLRTGAVRTFVQGMEQRRLGPHGWTSVFSVMRD